MDWPRRAIKKKKDQPSGGGPDVLPGVYTVQLALGEHRAEADVVVHPDPRVPYDQKAHEMRRLHQQVVMEAVKPISIGMDQIQRALATIEVVEQELKWIPDSLKKDAKTLADSLKSTLREVEEIYTEPRDFKGIESVTERLSSVMWTAFSINGGKDAPGGNAMRALERLHEGASSFVKAVDDAMTGVWVDWLEAVEAIDRSPGRLYEAAGEQEE